MAHPTTDSTREDILTARAKARARARAAIQEETRLARELRTQHPNIYLTRTQALLEARRILNRT